VGGGLHRDLLFYYGVDLLSVIRGDGPPPSIILPLIEYMPVGSVTHSLLNNTPDAIGYGVLERILSDVDDWCQAGALSAGNWAKGKEPKFRGIDRPWVKKAKPVASEGMAISDLHAIFQAKLNR